MNAIADPRTTLNPTRRRLLLVAIIVGCFSAALMYLYVTAKTDEVTKVGGPPTEIIVAATDLPRGTVLQQSHMSSKLVPSQYLPPNPIYPNDAALYVGQTTGVNVESGAMILTSDFVQEVQSYKLSMRIPPDQRAFTIPVDAITGIAGLLSPGDRVDLLYTLPLATDDQVIKEGDRSAEGYVTMTLVQNVTVLAVGAQMSEYHQADNRQQGYNSVTVLVSPDEVELLTISQTRGKLSLSLRGPEDYEERPYRTHSLRDVLKQLDLIKRPNRKLECIQWGPEVMIGDGAARKKCLKWG